MLSKNNNKRLIVGLNISHILVMIKSVPHAKYLLEVLIAYNAATELNVNCIYMSVCKKNAKIIEIFVNMYE